MVHFCNPIDQKVGARGSGIQVETWLHVEFEACLGYEYMKLSPKFVQLGQGVYSWRNGSEVRALASFQEDPDCIPSMNMVAHNSLLLLFQES